MSRGLRPEWFGSIWGWFGSVWDDSGTVWFGMPVWNCLGQCWCLFGAVLGTCLRRFGIVCDCLGQFWVGACLGLLGAVWDWLGA